ncbi:MAG: C-terminal binding protein [Eubacteriales bacterium]
MITDYLYESIEKEKKIIESIGAELNDYQCKTEEDVIEKAKDADAIIVQFAPITRKVIESLENCKVIVRYAVGVDNIDLHAATEKGIYVCNVPDYAIDEVSDHTLLLILAIERKLQTFMRNVQKGDWTYTYVKPLNRLKGQVLGLMGFGRIPRMVAEKAKPFGFEIITYDPFVSEEILNEYHVKRVDFDTLLKESDVLSIHTPLNDKTKHLVNTEAFKKMTKKPFIVNTSRGGIIDEKALIKALGDKLIRGAALDVIEKEPIDITNELLKMDNVIITPHSAWYTEESIKTLQKYTAEEVKRVLSGNTPKNAVNKL